MPKDTRTIIIGLDGVPFGMLRDFAETGVMPNTAELISRGTFRKMFSSIPEVSSTAWSSIITGENPGRHGIFGFTDLVTGSYKMRFPNFNDLKCPPFWSSWKGKSVIINVPSTYPVREMNGAHISGFVSIDFEKSVYPSSLIPQLKKLDYRLDVDAQKAHSSMNLFLTDLDQTLDARIQAYRYLWKMQDWQTFMLVFTGTDRLMHFLWEAYENKDHRHHTFFLDHFRKIDQAVGEIADMISDDDLVVLLSDHGFERLDYDVHINYLLMQQGFLQFKPGENDDLNNICYGTKAFSLDPARIYLNHKGRFPCGTVTVAEVEDVLSDLENIFSSLQVNGRKIIRDIYRKEQIYSGPYLETAPDLVLVGAEGFNLKSDMRARQLTDKSIFTGKHTQNSAFLLVKGPAEGIIVPEAPNVSQVKGIVENLQKQE